MLICLVKSRLTCTNCISQVKQLRNGLRQSYSVQKYPFLLAPSTTCVRVTMLMTGYAVWKSISFTRKSQSTRYVVLLHHCTISLPIYQRHKLEDVVTVVNCLNFIIVSTHSCHEFSAILRRSLVVAKYLASANFRSCSMMRTRHVSVHIWI